MWNKLLSPKKALQKNSKMAQIKQTIYKPYEIQYQNELHRIKHAGLSPENLQILARFHEYLFSKGNSRQRVIKLSMELRRLCKMMKELGITKNLIEFEKPDLVKLVSHINLHPKYSENTKHDYRRVIKQFYYWYEDDDPRLQDSRKDEVTKMYRYIRKEMRKRGVENKADPNTIITQEDLQKVLTKGCRNYYERAFISVLHETGARIGEFMKLKVGHIQPLEHKTKVYIPQDKTVPREVYSFESWPHLKAYLDNHPYKDDPDAYLWLSQSNRNRGELVKYTGIKKMLRLCFQRAGVNKKNNPHWFRHSRATLWATEFTTQVLCKYMGWSMNGRQVKNYVHLSQAQLENEFDQAHGIQNARNEKPKVVACICGTQNPSSAACCVKCYRPLTLKDAVNLEQLKNNEIGKTVNFLMELAKNPEEWASFQKFKQMHKG